MKLPVQSSLITQVPLFVVEEKPIFMSFLDAYYEFLEQDGYSVDYIRNVLSFLDVDRTLDRFINFFWEEVKDIPLDARVDRRLLAKHIYDLYQSKGTIKSYKLLFRILYNEDIEIYAPKIDMLRVSDGKWEIDYIVRCTALTGNPFDLIGLTLHQSGPDASFLIQNVIKKTYGLVDYYDLFIEPLTVLGTFRTGEQAFAHWTDKNGVEQTITVFLPAMPATLDVRESGSYYSAGEVIDLYDTTGEDFVARVSEIGMGRIEDVLILNGGSGYSVGERLTVDNTGTNGTGLVVAVSAVDAGVVTKLNVVNAGGSYNFLPVLTGAHGGKFLAISSKIGRILDVTTSDLGHDHANQATETNIRTTGIITDPTGAFVSDESIVLLDECLLTENYYAILAEDGTRILNEQLVSQITEAKIFSVTNNQITLDGQITRRAIEEEDASGLILAEDGGAMLNELSSADLYRRTIVGATSGSITRIIDINPASIVFNIGALAVTAKHFTNLDGKISEATKHIQDSRFYQDFSYVIKSSQSIDSYRNIVQRLIHPAGLAMFGEVTSNNFLQIGLRLIEQLERIVNMEVFANLGFKPTVNGTFISLSQQSFLLNDRSTLMAFDHWKFPYLGSLDSVYQSDTLLGNFANMTCSDIYEYDGDDNVIGYQHKNTVYNRGSEIRVNGILI